MPTPVSSTANSSTASARDSASLANWRPSATPIRSLTPPDSVNLNAFESRFLSTCCSRCSSVSIAGGTFAPWTSISKLEALVLGDRPERPLDEVAHVGERDVADVDVHPPGLDLREVEDVVDQVEQVRARRVDRAGELDLLVAQVPLRVLAQQLREDQQRVERRPQLVRHVREELGLVARRQRELLRLLLERRAGELDLAVLDLDAPVLLLEQLRLLLQLLVRLLELLLLRLQQLLRGLQRRRLLLELLVRLLELLLLRLQLLGLACSSCVSPATATAAPRSACSR